MSQRNRGRPKCRPPWWVLYPKVYEELKSALTKQPHLRLREMNNAVSIRGRFQVVADGKVIDSFRIRIAIPDSYPRQLPILYETEKRIPKIPNRHVNPKNGDACLYVPEEWKAKRRDASFSTWLNVPVRNFFFGQLYYEQHKRFPHGERAHYLSGMIEGYVDVLDVEPKEKKLHYWLRILAAKTSKGHWECPCGSRKIIRKCCYNKVYAKRQMIDRKLAREMLRKLTTYMNVKKD